MMKRLKGFLMLACVCMAMIMVPMIVKAGGGVETEVWVYSYETLQEALQNDDVILIYTSGDYSAGRDLTFTWPTEDVTLTINKKISLSGDWTIPENVTFNFESNGLLYDSSSKEVCLTTNGTITHGCVYVDKLVVNGDVVLERFYENIRDIVVNGSLETLYHMRNIKSMTVSEGATLFGEYQFNGILQMNNAEIGSDAKIQVDSDKIDILGTGTISTLSANGQTINIGSESSEGTSINVEYLYLNDSNGATVVNIYNELNVGEGYHVITSSVFNIAKNGVLGLLPSCQFGDESNTEARIVGNGTLKGYAEIHEVFGTYVSRPYIFGKQFGVKPRPSQIASTVKISHIWPEEKQANPFSDVEEDNWQYDYVQFAWEYNLMSGKGTDEDGKILFDPNAFMTRAEFVQLLYSKEGKPAVDYSEVFSDVPDGAWYTSAVIWANANGIVTGTGDTFDVNGKITREQMAAILYKYAEYKGYDVSGRKELTGFEDVDMISSWAVDRMQWALDYGVMAGSGTNLNPIKSAARAEAAAMMRSFMVAYEGIEKK